MEHFSSCGLQGLLGNQQTLYLVSRIAGQETLPTTKKELFERAIDVLWLEHNEAKSANELAREAVLNMRRYYEPQLEARYAGANLHALMRSAEDALLATELAAEWIVRFPALPALSKPSLLGN